MTNAELLKTVSDLKGLMNMAAELQDQISALEDSVKAEMTAQNLDRFFIGDFKVLWTSYQSKRLDSKALKAELPDIYNRYAVTTTARRFSVN